MLRTSRQNPNKTGYEELHGQFDFNKTPIAPLETRALIYDNPDSRTSWASHGTDAFYVSPAPLTQNQDHFAHQDHVYLVLGRRREASKS